MQEEKTSQKTNKNTLKHIILLATGIIVTIVAIYIQSEKLTKYITPIHIIGYFLSYLIPYLLGIGLIALIISPIMGNVKKFWLPAFAWLFLIFGLFITVANLSKIPRFKYAFKQNINKLLKQEKPPKGILTHIGRPMISGLRPHDGATIKDTSLIIFWPRTNYAVSYDVYFGDNFEDVNAGARSTFVGNQTYTSTSVGIRGSRLPDDLVPGTTYYWRIDEVNEAEPDSPWKGYVWRFTVRKNYDSIY
jgi:hypothetical protein